MAASSKAGFLTDVDRTISVHHMFRSGDSVLVGVSGGPDSVALFHALIEFIPRYALRLGVAHVNHCLRSRDSDRDARFVAELAQKHGVPFYLKEENVQQYARSRRLSIEEAGRAVRYDFMTTLADQKGFDRIALGHHSDDNAELILMVLIRGGGLAGLSGISPVRGDRFVRPLITKTRSEILQFLHAQGIGYVTDASNTDPRHLRNRIRRHLLPLLQTAYNPKITHNLNRLSDLVRADNEWLERQAHPWIEPCIVKRQKNRTVISLCRFTELAEALQRRLIRSVIFQLKGDLRRITYTHIEAARHLARRGPGYGSLDLPDRIRVTRQPETLILSKEKEPLRRVRPVAGGAVQTRFEYRIAASATVSIREIGMVLTTSVLPMNEQPDVKTAGHRVAFFDMDTLKFPLILRNYQPGDRFSRLGLGGTQKVKYFFINHKVPSKERVNHPVLLCGKRIIWVAGHRIDASATITPATQRVLRAELFLA